MRTVLFTYYPNSNKRLEALLIENVQGLDFIYSYKIDTDNDTVKSKVFV